MAERDVLIRRLAARALTRPANVLTGAAVAATGIALDLWPLYPVAGAVYLGLSVTSFFSVNEARNVLHAERGPRVALPAAESLRLVDPEIRQRYDEARTEEGRVREALAQSPVELPEVEVELTGLMSDVGGLCQRADRVLAYLTSVNEPRVRADRERAAAQAQDAEPDLAPTLNETVAALDQQIETIEAMGRDLDRFDAQMTQLTSSLGAIRGQVARLAIEATPDASARVLDQVASARAYVSGLAQHLDELGEHH